MKHKVDAILKRLTQARKQADLSQGQVSRMIGLTTQKGFSGIERGVNPLSVERLLMLCDIYDVDVMWVITGINANFDLSGIWAIAEQSNMIRDEADYLIELLSSLNHGGAK
jgi:transcriptional regulator with XRE-family HTH domain